jgi:hypothetical protein
VGLSPFGTAATSGGLLYQPQMIGAGDCGAIGGMRIGKGKRITPARPEPGSNPGRRGWEAGTNRLSYGAAY